MRGDVLTYYKTLTSAAVTGGKDTRDVGVVLASWRLDVLPCIKLDVVVVETLRLGSEETKGQKDEVSREVLGRVLHLLHIPSTSSSLGPLDTNDIDTLDVPAAIVDELLGHNTVLTRVYNMLAESKIYVDVSHLPFPW